MQRFRSFLAILLIPAICWLFTNAVVNQHSHVLANGQIITHSHPYTLDKNNHSPFQSHHHNPSTLEFLAQLSNPHTVLGIVMAVLSVSLFVFETKTFRISANPLVRLSWGLIPNRAPPAID